MRTGIKMTSEERRRCILDRAKELFAEKGFLGVTTRQLAAAAGVTEPVIYEHFSSKRRLYDEILVSEAQSRVAEFARSLEEHEKQRDDEKFFLSAGKALMERNQDDPAKLRFFLQVILEGGEPARLFYENQVLPTHEMLRRYIHLRMEEGAFLKGDARVPARQFVGFVIYHSTLQQLVCDTFLSTGSSGVLEEFVRNFLRGLKAGE